MTVGTQVVQRAPSLEIYKHNMQNIATLFYLTRRKAPYRALSSSSCRDLNSVSRGANEALIDLDQNGQKSVSRGANGALIELDQNWPKIMCNGVPTKLELTKNGQK